MHGIGAQQLHCGRVSGCDLMRHDTGSDASKNEPVMVMSEHAQLGQSLRDKRDELDIGLDEIVRTTKISKASLLSIEAGEFDKLPGDVFARGFLRSYARCVGLDGDEVVQRYARCSLDPAPVSSVLADSQVAERRKNRRSPNSSPNSSVETEGIETSDSTTSSVTTPSIQVSKDNAIRKVLRDAFDLGRGKRAASAGKTPRDSSTRSDSSVDVASSAPTQKRVRTFLPPSFDSQDDMTHRGPLTLGVIILVIVATLTMSYLLRRPGTNTDGFTMNTPSVNDSGVSHTGRAHTGRAHTGRV